MDFGVSIFLIAVGAILTWAVTVTTSGVDIHTIGVILMLAGILGLLTSLVWYGMSTSRGAARTTWYAPRYRRTVDPYTETRVVERRDVI
ncbi:MAG TPA: DUF6458 family protein [Acidimicrobiales bacterium]|jgi:hypothetical protein